MALEHARHREDVPDVVVDDEHLAAGERRRRPRRGSRACRRPRRRQRRQRPCIEQRRGVEEALRRQPPIAPCGEPPRRFNSASARFDSPSGANTATGTCLRVDFAEPPAPSRSRRRRSPRSRTWPRSTRASASRHVAAECTTACDVRGRAREPVAGDVVRARARPASAAHGRPRSASVVEHAVRGSLARARAS